MIICQFFNNKLHDFVRYFLFLFEQCTQLVGIGSLLLMHQQSIRIPDFTEIRLRIACYRKDRL